MLSVVTERNRLIHQMLAKFDPASAGSCEALSADLDRQREHIVPAYEHLESLVRVVRAAHSDLAEFVDRSLAAQIAKQVDNDA